MNTVALPERLVLLTEEEVSEWVKVPVNTLRYWRGKEVGIPWIHLAERTVRYNEAAVNAWLLRKTVTPETEEPAWESTAPSTIN